MFSSSFSSFILCRQATVYGQEPICRVERYLLKRGDADKEVIQI